MRRDQLEHAIRTACQIIHQPEVIVVGSQAILGTYDESQLPAAATMSIEVDILPIADSNDLETAVLPDGWRDRLVKVQNANTAAPAGEPRFTGWCLDKENLCAAKLVALREKDRNFVAALLKANLVDANLIASRLRTIPREHVAAREAALTWLSSKD
ncbi:MAG: hypothetical protein LH477_17890 [Nocardioides sp.]|nr:hypothetical protein [Nocardioides sp.]